MSDPRFTVRPSPTGVGGGLFGVTPVKKSDFILEYTGKKIPTSVADKHPGRYLFEIDGEWTLDGDTPENLAKYINHSCDPNTEAEIVDDKILIHAIKDVPVGEELTIDYGQEYFDEFIKPTGCKCGASKHRS